MWLTVLKAGRPKLTMMAFGEDLMPQNLWQKQKRAREDGTRKKRGELIFLLGTHFHRNKPTVLLMALIHS
jgi:hypothetical protein